MGQQQGQTRKTVKLSNYLKSLLSEIEKLFKNVVRVQFYHLRNLFILHEQKIIHCCS